MPVPGIVLQVDLTPRQQQAWQGMNQFNILVSKCFAANSLHNDDPIDHYLNGDKTDKVLHALVWSYTHLLRSLWDLTQQAFLYLQKEAKSLQGEIIYETAFDYFVATVALEEQNNFDRYLKQFHEFSIPKAIKEASIRKKTQSCLTEEERQALRNIEEDIPPNQLFLCLIAVSEAKSKQNRALQNALERFHLSSRQYYFAREDLLKSGAKGRIRYKLYSFSILNGEEVKRRKTA